MTADAEALIVHAQHKVSSGGSRNAGHLNSDLFCRLSASGNPGI